MSLTKHPELGKAIKSLSLLLEGPYPIVKGSFPRLDHLLAALIQNNHALELIVVERCGSPRRSIQDWEIWNGNRGQGSGWGIFPIIGVARQLNHGGLRVKSFVYKGYYTRTDCLFGTTDIENKIWKRALSCVESVSLHFSWDKDQDENYRVLASLPALQSLCLARGSFRQLGRYSDGAYIPFRFPYLKSVKVLEWQSTPLAELVIFLKEQPRLEKIDLGSTVLNPGMGSTLSEIGKPGEDLEYLLKRVAGVKQVIVSSKLNLWVAGVIKARVG